MFFSTCLAGTASEVSSHELGLNWDRDWLKKNMASFYFENLGLEYGCRFFRNLRSAFWRNVARTIIIEIWNVIHS